MKDFECRRGRHRGSPPRPPVSRRRPAWQPERGPARPSPRSRETPPPSPGGSETKIQARDEEGGGVFSRRSPVFHMHDSCRGMLKFNYLIGIMQ